MFTAIEGREKMAPAKVTAAVIVVVLKVTGRAAQVYRVCASFGQVLQAVGCGQTREHETCKT